MTICEWCEGSGIDGEGVAVGNPYPCVDCQGTGEEINREKEALLMCYECSDNQDALVSERVAKMTLNELILNLENDLQEDGDTGAHLDMTIGEYLASLPNSGCERLSL